MDFSLSEFLSGATALYLTKELVKWYKTFRGKNADLAQNMKDIQEIHDIMEHVIRHTLYDRFVIFMAEDSAGMLTVGKKLFISAQYEKIVEPKDDEYDTTRFSLLDVIQRWRADEYYYKIFSEMVSNGSVSLCTENMPKSNLKDIYLSQNVKSAEVYHLMTTKGLDKVFYCSIATRQDKVVETAEDRVKVTSAISQLIEIFKRHRKYY